MNNSCQWTEIKCSGIIPTNCTRHTTVVYKNHIFLYGGTSKQSHNASHLYSLNTSTMEWSIVNAKNAPPIQRFHHTCVVHENSCFVFGGTNFNNDVHKYDFIRNEWTTLNVTGLSPPTRRFGHSAVIMYISKIPHMIIYGGSAFPIPDLLQDKYAMVDTFGVKDEVYALNLLNYRWNLIRCNAPSPRFDHSSCVFRNEMYVFGGNNGIVMLDDLYRMNSNYNWKKLQPIGIAPCARSGHACVTFEDYMFVIGGQSDNFVLQDVYQLNFTMNMWSKVNLKNEPPNIEISSHSVSLIGNELYVHGRVFGEKKMKTFKLELHRISSPSFNFSKIFNSDILSDVLILVNDKKFYAHKCIISQSRKFKEIIQNTQQHQLERIEIDMNNTSPEACEKILRFMYTGEVSLDKCDVEVFIEIWNLSIEYELPLLTISCFKQFPKLLTNETVLPFLERVKEYQIKELEILCLNYFYEHRRDITMLQREYLKNMDKDLSFDLLNLSNFQPLMPPPIEIHTLHTLDEHIKHLYTTKEFADVQFISADNQILMAHKCIIYTLSNHFKDTMLSLDPNEIGEVHVNDINFDLLKIIFEYMYCKTVSFPTNPIVLLCLLSATSQMEMKELNSYVVEKIMSSLNHENVLEVLQYCIKYDIAKSIQERCKNILQELPKEEIVNNIESITRKFLRIQIHEEYMQLKEEVSLLKKEISKISERCAQTEKENIQLKTQIQELVKVQDVLKKFFTQQCDNF